MSDRLQVIWVTSFCYSLQSWAFDQPASMLKFSTERVREVCELALEVTLFRNSLPNKMQRGDDGGLHETRG